MNSGSDNCSAESIAVGLQPTAVKINKAPAKFASSLYSINFLSNNVS
jgi:hypothetical protein